ncbi:hypothetical protein [Streptomyces xanthochromogenes]|uniref:hypothetical protein n=1 Tax=Streptomyces xanthochromogenes TaxID=67384 RepID=UPI00342A0BB1
MRAIDRDTRMGGLGPGERLYAFIHAVHADHAGADRVGMARVGALMGVNTDSVTDYHRAVEACGAISAQRTRRQDGRRGGYRTVVSAIAEAATREGGRRMGPRECAIVSRWALALLSDRDMEPLGPDDRWRVVQLAAGYPDGVFLASRADLAALWGLGVRTAAGVVRRLRTAGVLSGSQHSRRAGVPSTRWSIVPVAAAVETASTAFDMLATQRVSAAHPCDADIPGGTAPPPRRSARS